MFGQNFDLRSPSAPLHKSHSHSTVSSQKGYNKPIDPVVQEFSLDLSTPKHKLCTKLSNTTKCSDVSENVDLHSFQEVMREDSVTFDSKTSICQMYFNSMYCENGSQCMFSHEDDALHSSAKCSLSLSLFQLLSEYPELALVRGGRREYSLLFN